MAVWPFWWNWALLFTAYARRRMAERHVSETDVRRMFADATELRPGSRPGRWVASTRHEGESWRLVIEPKPASQRLALITVYPLRPLQ